MTDYSDGGASRRVINVAIGVLVRLLGCAERDAFINSSRPCTAPAARPAG